MQPLSLHIANDGRRMRFNNDVGTDEDAVHLGWLCACIQLECGWLDLDIIDYAVI